MLIDKRTPSVNGIYHFVTPVLLRTKIRKDAKLQAILKKTV